MWATVGVGVLTLAACVAVQSSALVLVVRVVARLARRGFFGGGFWLGVVVLEVTTLVLFASFLVQMALWAWVFVLCGEFADYGEAFYHSAVNYTTLGYGDIVMSPRWRLLGPMEAANGVLMGGLAAAGLFAVLTRLGVASRILPPE
ncbi:MAG: potassium channel family protein [Gemmataceae bacterium]|nr:potassium channel family protein [Gemmataceae bacterium]